MENLWIVLVFACFNFPTHTDAAMKCWECYSDKSWEDCINYQQLTCLGDQDQCGLVYFKQGNVLNYYRGCYTKTFCEMKPPCNDASVTSCNIECCSGDNCNGGTPNG